MADTRMKNAGWIVSDNNGETSRSVHHSQLAVLMDIRDELQAIRARLDCHEALAIPRYLRRISANTAKPRPKKR